MSSILMKEEKGYRTADNATWAHILASQDRQYVFSMGANDL